MTQTPPWETLQTLAARAGEVNLFVSATRLARLEEAWEKVRQNNGCAGSDGVTVGHFAKRLSQRLHGLRNHLQNNSYAPHPLRLIDIPKSGGETRRLAIPAIADRIAQTAFAITLQPLIEGELADASFAYRPGRSVKMAVDRIEQYRDQGFRHVLETDIEDFFDAIPHERLIRKLEALLAGTGGRDETVALIRLWLEASGLDLASPGRGIGQGSPLSPMLANLYLDTVDDALNQNPRFRLVRFADDLVIMTRTASLAGQARDDLDEQLSHHGLKLNQTKTRIGGFERGFQFLGHLFVRSMVLKARKQDREDEQDVDDLMRWVARRDTEKTDSERAEAERRAAGLDPGLRALYVREPGRVLDARDRAFTVTETTLGKRRELLAVPATAVDRIEVGPGVRFEQNALELAMLTGTLIHHVDGHGGARARTIPASSQHAALHMGQAGLALDPARRRAMALTLVDARIRNQRALLRRLNRKPKLKSVLKALTSINALISRLPLAATIDQLMGYEGAAAKLYWPALACLIKPEWASTPQFLRTRQPAADPVNIVLNYTAHLLARDLETLVHRHGLHPGFASLHGIQDGNTALVFDLMEEFRAPLAEALTMYLFNNRILSSAHFTATNPGSDCRLLPSGHAAIIQNHHRWLERPVKSRRRDTRVTWRRLVEEQIIAFAQHCRDKQNYQPYFMDY